MVGDELPLTAMTSTTMTIKANATTGTHLARYQERLAGGTAVKLPRGWAVAASVTVRCLGGKVQPPPSGSDRSALRGDPGLRAAAHKRPSTGLFDESWIGERYATAPMTPPTWQR